MHIELFPGILRVSLSFWTLLYVINNSKLIDGLAQSLDTLNNLAVHRLLIEKWGISTQFQL